MHQPVPGYKIVGSCKLRESEHEKKNNKQTNKPTKKTKGQDKQKEKKKRGETGEILFPGRGYAHIMAND